MLIGPEIIPPRVRLVQYFLDDIAGGDGLPDFHPDGLPHRGRHGVADLAVLVQRRPGEPERVREALRAGALPHADDSVLLRVQDPALGGDSIEKNLA